MINELQRTPNWKYDIDLTNKCAICEHYAVFIKKGKVTARGTCLLKNEYKQRTESCKDFKDF